MSFAVNWGEGARDFLGLQSTARLVIVLPNTINQYAGRALLEGLVDVRFAMRIDRLTPPEIVKAGVVGHLSRFGSDYVEDYGADGTLRGAQALIFPLTFSFQQLHATPRKRAVL